MIKKLNYLLTKKDKKILFVLLIMSLFLSVIETIGITAIMPFISIASNNNLILTNEYYAVAYDFFGFNNPKEFIVYFGITLIIFYIFRGIYIVLYGYLINRFSMNKYISFANKIFENYVNMPYAKFVTKNTATMSKTLTSEAYQLAFVIQNIMVFISEILIISLLYILLLFVNVKMTILLTAILGVKVLLLKIIVSRKIKNKGDKRAIIQNDLYRTITETLGNFKIIKFISNQKQVLNSFSEITSSYSKVYIISNTLQLIPKNVLEMTGFSILIGVVVYMVAYSADVASMIPIVSMYALALYRILPAITKILNSYNNIVFHSASLDIVYNDVSYKYDKEYSGNIKFKHTINVNNISFSYIKDTKILKDLTLKIEKGKKIAFIGESGSGKSTLVDLICGVYKPDRGNILIDGIKLDNSNIVSWRKRIGYIPQSIYLFDATIADNITFGRGYDEDKLVKVLKQANVYDFVMQKEGFNTMVGEGGIQLSGGQKQRVGIARALYGEPDILVLDEATSALDTDTEKAIMDEIYRASEDKTLMIIAHRLSTIQRCDIKIELGRINKK